MKKKSTIFNTIPLVVPETGMGATIQLYSDREPATIIQVTHNGKRIVIQEDKATRIDNNGAYGNQEYQYERDPNGAIHIATLRKDGRFRLVGGTTLIHIGSRRKYYDYSF